MHVHQINLQPAVGGGEVYTRWFTRALADAGARVTLHVDAANRFWDGLAAGPIDVSAARNPADIPARLAGRRALIVTQSRLPDALLEVAARDHVLTGFAHMPMVGRSASGFARYAAVFTVSEYCIGLLRQAGLSQVYPHALYGTGELDRVALPASIGEIRAASPYHWDTRKGRDRVLSLLEPFARSFLAPRTFKREPGLTLGVVSLLSPIKQFPALFEFIAPHLARCAQVRLEVFGNGGYAQVRDIKRSLAPLGDRVRFWGYQDAVREIYPQIDYLLTGLPEKEALGLNVLEAQALGTPVLAPQAPPFTETVAHGQTGFLYRDPREDAGRAFGELLGSLIAGRPRPDPRAAAAHLSRFSYASMVERAGQLLAFVERQFPELRCA